MLGPLNIVALAPVRTDRFEGGLRLSEKDRRDLWFSLSL